MRWWCQEQSSMPSFRSVRPPRHQGSPAWCASHQVAGTWQPSAWQVRLCDGEGLALGGGEEPLGAAEVEDLGGAVEDGRDDPGAAGEAAGFAGADPGAVTEDADAGLRGQVVVGRWSPPRWSRPRRAAAAGRGRTASSRAQNAWPRRWSAGTRRPSVSSVSSVSSVRRRRRSGRLVGARCPGAGPVWQFVGVR